jgi:acyl carrier protein
VKPDVAAAVASAIESVLRDTGRHTKPVEPAMLLAADLGLDSLDLAQTIVLLERSLGIDPFRSASTSRTVRTVSDLVAIYETALASRDV